MFILNIKAQFTHFSANIKKNVVFPNRLLLKNNEMYCIINKDTLHKRVYPQTYKTSKFPHFTQSDS